MAEEKKFYSYRQFCDRYMSWREENYETLHFNAVSGTDSRGNAYTNWYYVQADGSLLRDGWHEVNGKTCYFDANGYNYRNRWITLENGNRRYLGEDGALKKDEWCKNRRLSAHCTLN